VRGELASSGAAGGAQAADPHGMNSLLLRAQYRRTTEPGRP
jgi:hypothetical protein